MKIKFFIPGGWTTQLWIPSIYYMLRTAYDISGQYPEQVTWQKSYFFDNSVDAMYSAFEQELPDIICLSIYLWNQHTLHPFAKKVKANYPNTIIILGGPDIQWQTYKQYIQTHPYYNYIVYGDSEEAFPKLIDLIVSGKDRTIDLLNIPNLIFTDVKNIVHKTPHKIYRGNLFTEYSPLIHCKEEFLEDCDIIRARGAKIAIIFETDRGCPYKCSFCDWSAGLHTKVTKKKYSPNDEIYLIAEQGCLVHIGNANFGFYEQDVEILRLFWTLASSGNYPGFELYSPSWAKLNKDKVHAMYKLQAEITGSLHTKISLQSITPAVLENIDRPAIPWTEYKELLSNLVTEIQGPVTYEMITIVGLPGETVDSWNHMMNEFADLPMRIEGDRYGVGFWYLLPNSPGADPEYIQKYQLDVLTTVIPHEDVDITVMPEDEDKIIEHMYSPESTLAYQSTNVWGTYSANAEDVLYMILAHGMFQWVKIVTNNKSEHAKKLFNSLIPKMKERVAKDAKKFQHYYKKYNAMPFYVIHKNKLYPYDIACRSFPSEMIF